MTTRDPHTVDSSVTPRKKRRLWRWLAWFVIATALLLLVVTLVARHYLRPDRLRRLAIETVEKSMPRKMHIADFDYHLLHGLVLKGVSIHAADSLQDLFPLRHLSFREMRLQYSLRDLLQRRFIVNEISLLEPELELFVDMSTPSAIDLEALLATSLPIDFDVKKIRLQDAKFKIVLADSQYNQSYRVGQMSILVDELHLPKKGWSANDSLLHGTLRVLCEHTSLHVEYLDIPSSARMQLDSDLNVDSRIDIHSFRRIRLNTALKLGNLHLLYEPQTVTLPTTFSLGLDADINAREGNVAVQTRLAVDDREWLAATVAVDSLFQQPKYRVHVSHGEIPLAQLLQMTRHVLPDSLIPVTITESAQPVFRCDGMVLEGRLPSPSSDGKMDFRVNGRLSHTDFFDPGRSWLARGVGFSVQAEGHGNGKSLHTLTLQANADLDSLHYALNDTMAVFSGHGQLYFYSRLNERLLPEKTRLSFTLANCMGGAMEGEMDLTGELSLARLAGKGRFSWLDIPLHHLAATPVQGNLSLRSDFSLSGLDHLAASVQLSTTPLLVATEDRPLSVSGLRFDSRVRAGVDTTFSRIHLDSIRINLNDITRMRGRADVDLVAGNFTMDLDEGLLEHGALLNWLPGSLFEQYGELAVTGQTRLQVHGKGSMTNGSLRYHLTGELTTRNTSFYDPDHFLAIGGVGVQAAWQVDDRSGLAAQLGVSVDSLTMSGGTNISYLNNHVALQLSSPDFTSYTINKGELAIPDVRSTASFTAHWQDSTVTAQLEIHQAIPDSFVIRDLVMRGATDVVLGIQADPALVNILAEIHSRNWSLSMPGLADVRGLQADLFVQQLYDVRKGQFLGSDEYLIATPAHGVLDYFLYRDFFRQRQPHLSRITIEQVEIMSYALQNIRLELLADQGRIEVPALEATLLGGNVTGRLSVDLAGGDLAGASYRMSGHFANINSYLLTRYAAIPRDDGVVNGNLEFRGSGLNPEEQMVLDGHFYITQIGPTAAANLLNYLDPEAKDSGISTSRMLIRNGFKPKLMSFDFRNLHMYPVIEFAKPWYLPRGLDRIELNRIPLQFFMNRMRARAGWETASR